jgi:hypothetical protein
MTARGGRFGRVDQGVASVNEEPNGHGHDREVVGTYAPGVYSSVPPRQHAGNLE